MVSMPGGAAPRPMLGISLVLLMGACFATLDTSAKVLGLVLPVMVVLLARYLSQSILMGAWLGARWLRNGENLFRMRHPKFQLVRGTLLMLCSALLIYGIRFMPVAEFTAIGMLTPVIVTVLAAVVLHEHVSLTRGLLVLGGFTGALIVIRPGSGLFGWVALIPLLMAFLYAVFQLLTRSLSHLEHPLTTHFYTGLVGTVIVCIAYAAFSPLQDWRLLQSASVSTWAVLALAGCAGTAGHLLLILALGVAPMPILMPFIYAQIAFASVAGWLAFGHLPDGWAIAGMCIVAASGALSVWLNLRESAKALRLAPIESALTAE